MKIGFIKKINEALPYSLKKPFAGFIRERLIGNAVFAETYAELEQFDALSPEEKKRIQLCRLKDLLQYVYGHSEYYRRLFDEYRFKPDEISSTEDLHSLPTLKKSDLNTHLDEIVTDDIKDAYLVTTGGTTGEPTRVWMEKDAIYKEMAFVYHFWSKYGYDYKHSRLATFRGVDLGKKICEINPLYAEIRLNTFLLNESNIRDYLKEIDDYGADFIYGYPSAVYNFCRIAEKLNIDLKNRFKAALLISENLYDFQESVITRVLNCEVAIFYGHSERAVFGERTGQYYSFHPLYGVTEIGTNGEPIVTGFINRKTPLIRYEVDDEIQPVHEEGFLIHGHRDCDVVYGLNGEQFRGSILNFHACISQYVNKFQFVQNEIGHIEVHIADEHCEEEKIQKLTEELNSHFENRLRFRVIKTEQLQTTKRGKYKMVIQNCIQ